MAKLIFQRAIEVDDDSGEYISYWPEHWPIGLLAYEYFTDGSLFFAVNRQNDPSGLEGHLLKTEWLQYYLPEDLDAARAKHGGYGRVHIGADPAGGGTGANSDYTAFMAVERLGNVGYVLGMFNKRLPVEQQAPALESFADAYTNVTRIKIEDIAAKGYVSNALRNLNDGNGSKYPIDIVTPQTRDEAKGNKQVRFLAMAPRFEFGQIKLPGVRRGGQIVAHPDIAVFVQEWAAFPSGHDDALDAAYWMVRSAFGDEPTAYVIVDAPRTTRHETAPVEELCDRPAHLAFGKPLNQCTRCSMERRALLEDDDEADYTMGAPLYERRSSISIGLRRMRGGW